MYDIFIILLWNFKKSVHIHNYIGSFGRAYVLVISFQLYVSTTGLEVIYAGWVSMTPNLHTGRRTNQILI